MARQGAEKSDVLAAVLGYGIPYPFATPGPTEMAGQSNIHSGLIDKPEALQRRLGHFLPISCPGLPYRFPVLRCGLE